MFQINIHQTTPFKMIARHNYYAAMEEIKRFQKEASYAVRKEAINNILDEISDTAVKDYMRRGGGEPVKDKLTIRSGELARAVSNKAHPAHIQEVNTTPTGSRARGKVGAKATESLPYPHVHEQSGEYGDTFDIPPTGGTYMSWVGKYGKWAGKRTVTYKVSIPSRPYMQPAMDKVMGSEEPSKKIDKEIRKVIATKAFITYG